MPCLNFGEGIGADQEVHLTLRRQCSPHLFDRVDGVAALRQLLDARNLETRIDHDGQFDHADSVRIRSVRGAALVRRMGGGNEDDTLQRESIGGGACDRQVSLVNGIERAAEDCELQACWIFTELTRTSLTGRSIAPRGTLEIFSTTSYPSTTSPKMLCLSSNHGVAA